MYRWFEKLMFSQSGNDASSFFVPVELSSLFAPGLVFLPKYLVGQINLLLSINLGIFLLSRLSRNVPISLSLATFFHRHSPDWPDIPIFVARHSLCTDCASPDWWVWLLPSESQQSRLCFVLVSAWHQSQWALQFERENLWNGCQNMSGKLMILNKHRKWFHSSLQKLSFGPNVSELVLVSTNFIWILAKLPIKSNSVSSWHMSHCGTSSFNNLCLITASLS